MPIPIRPPSGGLENDSYIDPKFVLTMGSILPFFAFLRHCYDWDQSQYRY